MRNSGGGWGGDASDTVAGLADFSSEWEQDAVANRLKHAWPGLVGLVALILALFGGVWFWSYPPAPGGFFDADIEPGTAHGELIRSEPFVQDIPAGATATRILYRTSLTESTPATASAIVMWRENDDTARPRPALVWAHGTLGVLPGCGASLQARPFENVPGVEALLDEGWVFIASDYAGLTTDGPHPYLIGEGEARSLLDAALAAHALPELALSHETVVWGYSQGGHSALWSGIVARNYAPKLKILGAAAIAPASDLPTLLADIEETPEGRVLTSYVARAYADRYQDVSFNELIREGASWQAREMSARCLIGARALVPTLIGSKLVSGSIFEHSETWLAFRQRLTENVPNQPIGAPLLILQGQQDEVVAEPVQARFVAGRCAAGETVDYQTFEGHDHLSIVQNDAPSISVLVEWTRARFEGQPAMSTCD